MKIRDITLGQYVEGKSAIHKLDSTIKFILMISNIVFIFLCFNFYSLALMSAFIVLSIIISGVSLTKFIKSISAVIVMVLITGIINLFYGQGEPLVSFWIFNITLDGINTAIFVSVRIIILVLSSALLTYSTTPNDLSFAITRFIYPLKFIKVPIYDISMMMSIALRFIPTLLESTDKIVSAQKSRGASFHKGNIMKRVKALVPVVIPLFVQAFRRAFALSDAMESRCFKTGGTRVFIKPFVISMLEIISLIVAMLFYAGVIVLNVIL